MNGSRWYWLGAIAAFAVLGARQPGDHRATAAPPLSVQVTSSGDSVAGGTSVCPDATRCTLRRAIELVNADATDVPYSITFSPAAFPPATPATISVAATPLPTITRAQVSLDGAATGVVIDGGTLPGVPDGLRITGSQAVIRGISVFHFGGACILVAGDSSVVGGDYSLRQGNRAGNCGTGIAVRGASTTVVGNLVGFPLSGHDGAPVNIGILVAAGNVTVGSPMTNSVLANTIGRATNAIQVGDGLAMPFTGTTIVHNVIGKDPGDGGPAVVTTGVDIRQPSTGTVLTENTITYATTGIRVAPDAGGVSTTANRFLRNRFEEIGAMAIDLNGDNVRNPNDPGDADSGPNEMLNFPTILKATQSRVAGSAGASCPGCSVQLYFAHHEPGSPNDYGATPVATAVIVTDATGNFGLDSPPVTPGQWITTLVTDPAGNTSEFGPPARVGVGVVQCGNVPIQAGWNHAGYFGGEPFALGASFPDSGAPSKATAIYHYEKATGSYSRWLAGNVPGNTLDFLQAGEAYWFLAAEPFTVPGGFALNVPLPVELKAGWNEFVYIGATDDARDALASIGGKYGALYRWANDSTSGYWTAFGSADTPDWAREFTAVQACNSYHLFMNEDTTLVPLQP